MTNDQRGRSTNDGGKRHRWGTDGHRWGKTRIPKPEIRINDEIRMPNADSPLRRGGAEHAGRLHSANHRLLRLRLLPSDKGLAKKLQFPVAPPLNYVQRAHERRVIVLEMLLRDCTHVEMRKSLAIDIPVLQRDILTIYKKHGIKGKAHIGRRELAEKLGRAFVARAQYVTRKGGCGKEEAEREAKAGVE